MNAPSSAPARNVGSQDPVERLVRELRKLRLELRWPTLRDIAEATGIPRATLSQWLNKGRVPQWDRLVVLLRSYGVEAGSTSEERWKQVWRLAYSAHRARCYRRAPQVPKQREDSAAVSAPRRVAQGTGRRWAVVDAPKSPVHHEPGGDRRPLKYKHRDDRVELYIELPPSSDGGWLAVRTPADPPGYKWMPATDLKT